MVFSWKNILYVCCLMFFAGTTHAQVPQDLINKAKAAGISDAQIQQELSKMGQETATKTVATASEARVTDRAMPKDVEDDALEEERQAALQVGAKGNTVFGREIFSNKRLSFAPDLNIPTPKDYILAAGDELLIHVWGDSELNLKLKISPEGTILVPTLGPVAVSGLTVNNAEERLRQQLSQIMSTLSGEGDGNTFVSVSLSQIRSIKVNIVGEVVAPGTYTLPSLATLFNALYMAGGVNEIGSLRHIKVYRNSKEVADLDVYDYLLRGKYETNVRLEENDMVIVGPYEQLAVVRGEVKRNRIFEMRKGETLQQLLDMAGGFTGEAFTKDVQVKRKSDSRYRIATVPQDQFATFSMQDGDSLLVDAVVPFYENRLSITGAVWRPGEYELNESVHTVKQLIKQAEGLKGDEFAGRALITRLNPDFTNTTIAVDIRGILNGTSPDIALQSEDQLHIPSLFDVREPYTVKIGGAVNHPSTIPYRYNLTIEDAIIIAGGLKEAASLVRVEVARRIKNPTSEEQSTQIAQIYNFTLNEDLKLDENNQSFTLEPFDEINVRFSPGYHKQQTITINGEITFAGSYVLETKNARLSDLVAKAGGITPDAYVKGASLKRKLTEDELNRINAMLTMAEASKQSKDSIGLSMSNLKDYSVGIDLEKALKHPGSLDDIVLRDGDELYIPQMQSTVKMSGAVTYPNSVTYQNGMTVKSCLAQAGGYNDMARKYPIVIYMNGKVATTKRTAIFFKRYPKVEPGCEIVVPSKTLREQPRSMAEILSIGSSATSMAAMITSIINTLSK